MKHICEDCGCGFPISEQNRSQTRLFKKSGSPADYVEKVDEYFMVKCPACGSWQYSDEIRMLWLFKRKYAAVGLPLLLAFVVALSFVASRVLPSR